VSELLLIGRKERLDFPEWGLLHVRVKVDTGAWSSALDVTGYELEHVGPGAMVRLRLNVDHYRSRRREAYGEERGIDVRAPVVAMAAVRNSGGQQEVRPVVEALVRLGPVEKRIRLTLTNRSSMRCRMILGRQALAGSFLVDVGSKYLLRGKKR
jgi:hypothetical protein